MQAKMPGVAPLDVRLGIVAGRMTPALAEVTERLAANLPKHAAREMLAERFSVTPSVETYCRVVADLAMQVRTVHAESISSTTTQMLESCGARTSYFTCQFAKVETPAILESMPAKITTKISPRVCG